ncbi:MAG: hypothetical protein ACK5PS_05100 [Desulfopila sp.]
MSVLSGLTAWFDSTNIPQQVSEVDIVGLFTNPWFLVPFIALMVYLLYKQKVKDIILVVMILAMWWVSGTEYMHTLIVNGELQISKILPVLFGGAAALGLAIYLLFGRSD